MGNRLEEPSAGRLDMWDVVSQRGEFGVHVGRVSIFISEPGAG